MSLSPLSVSIIIPSVGRDKELIDTVGALAKQTVQPLEILVVDQNQPPLQGLDVALARAPRVRHIRSQRLGLCHNVNIGLREARGDIVLVLDDDIAPDDHLLEMHQARYLESSVSGVGGRVEQPQGDLDPSQIHVVGRFHPWLGKVTGNFNALSRTDMTSVPGGNMSFRREVLTKVKGMDCGFAGNAYYSDADLALRVVEAGYRIVFEPKASVQHLMAPRGGCRVFDKAEHTYSFLRNGVRLCRRHSPRAALPWIVVRMVAYSAAKALYNASPRIFVLGVKGVLDGFRQSLDIETELPGSP